LNSIQSFIINNDTDKATRYLAKFAQLMRLILTNSREAFVSVKDEVKTLTHYLDIEKLRFDNKFDYIIQVDPAIDDDFVGVPPMILQPYVENAILHGIIHLKERGKIIITLTQKHDIIQAIVEDNGIGRERAMKIKNESGLHHQSRGMNITRERLEILGRQTNQEINVIVIDLIDDLGSPAGTRVEINLPYREI
jgi:LytS/YehU family sensor histidine kinase